jgi:hypothetical protein
MTSDGVALRLGLRLSDTTGYAGRAFALHVVRRTIADGRLRVALWLADADFSGESMAQAAARYIEFPSTFARAPVPARARANSCRCLRPV